MISEAEALHTVGKLRIVADRKHQATVAGRKRLVRNKIRMRCAHSSGNRAAYEVVHVLIGKPGDLAVIQWHVDQLPFASLRSRIQRGEHGCSRIHSGHDVCDGYTDLLWPASLVVRRTGNTHQTADACTMAS